MSENQEDQENQKADLYEGVAFRGAAFEAVTCQVILEMAKNDEYATFSTKEGAMTYVDGRSSQFVRYAHCFLMRNNCRELCQHCGVTPSHKFRGEYGHDGLSWSSWNHNHSSVLIELFAKYSGTFDAFPGEIVCSGVTTREVLKVETAVTYSLESVKDLPALTTEWYVNEETIAWRIITEYAKRTMHLGYDDNTNGNEQFVGNYCVLAEIVVAMGQGNLLENRKQALIANKGYQDHKDDPVVSYEVTPHRGATRQFPTKLYEMLAQASAEGFDDIVSWQPHGRAFLVRKPASFVSDVMHR